MNDKPEYQNLYDQTMQIWVLPEIKRRQEEGNLPDPVKLRAVQVLFSIGGDSKVRINSEVKGNFEAKLKVPKEKGELIYENEVEFAEVRSLLEEDENFAHITMIRIGKEWSISFSFLYDTKEAEKTLAIGKEFLDSAKEDIEKNRPRAAINSMCVASEQIARASLILRPVDGDHRKSKTHGTISSSINRYSHISNIIPTEYAKAHNELTNLWGKARYDIKFTSSIKRLSEIASEIERFHSGTELLIKQHAS